MPLGRELFPTLAVLCGMSVDHALSVHTKVGCRTREASFQGRRNAAYPSVVASSLCFCVIPAVTGQY